MNNQLTVSPAPHIRSKESAKKIMWTVVLCLTPTGIAGVWIFGLYSLYVVLAGVLSAVFFEFALQKLCRGEPMCSPLMRGQTHRSAPTTISDGSAVITGLLLAYNMPPGVPLWLIVTGSFFGIAVAKHAFGGLGRNIFNPALVGRAFLMISWPVYMTRWVNPRFWPDTISSATPLAKIVLRPSSLVHRFTYWDFLVGNRGGCIGEVCVLAILLGAAFLLYKGYIRWHTPVTYIATVAILTWVFGAKGVFAGDGIFTVLAGGLMLGAFFMATDYVTTPLTDKGQVIFGLGCGILTFVIRRWAGYPEGVSYSILMMNAATPIIDRFTKPRVFGKK